MARVIRRSKTTPRVKDGRVQRKHYRDVEWGDRPLEILTRVPGLGHRHVLTRELVERFIALVPDWSELSRGLHTILLAEASSRADGWYNDGFIALTAWPDPAAITVCPEYHAAHREIWERLGVPSRPAPEFIAAFSGRDPNWISQDGMRALRRSLGGVDLEILPGEREGEWIGIDRGSEVPGTIVADLYRLEDEVHVYERCVFMRFDRITAAAYQLLHVFLHELGHHVDAMARPFPGRSVRGEDYAEQWANRCADQIWDEALAMLRR